MDLFTGIKLKLINEPDSFIKFRQFSIYDSSRLMAMIKSLYSEDESETEMSPEKIERTIKLLSASPERGLILIFENDDKEILGYSILINYWSNEYGGNITFIDELYIEKSFRNRSIATTFIKWIVSSGIQNSVIFQLEVTPANNNAKRLYERLGFKLMRNSNLRYYCH